MADHAEKQVKRMDKHRKLPAKGEFLAGAASYDEHGNLLPTGTVPPPEPRSRPDQGALTAHPHEQHAPVPEAPVTPDPYGGTTSASHASPDEQAQAKRIHEKEHQAKG